MPCKNKKIESGVLMTYTFFIPTPTTAEELKTTYRKLAIKHHPDCGGSTETMQTVNAEYKNLFSKLKDTHRNKEGQAYTSNTPTDELPEEFIEIINRLIRMEGISIEIIGRFIWVSGETKPHKDTLKEMRFKWHSTKICWYLAPDDYRKRNKKQFSMNEIRTMYGSQDVETRPQTKLSYANA